MKIWGTTYKGIGGMWPSEIIGSNLIVLILELRELNLLCCCQFRPIVRTQRIIPRSVIEIYREVGRNMLDVTDAPPTSDSATRSVSGVKVSVDVGEPEVAVNGPKVSEELPAPPRSLPYEADFSCISHRPFLIPTLVRAHAIGAQTVHQITHPPPFKFRSTVGLVGIG